MELRLPPVLQAGLSASLMAAFTILLPDGAVRLPWLAAVLGGAGLTFLALAVLDFAKSRTTVNPMHPDRAEKLVVGGLYRVSRNPMYVGMALLLCAFSAWAFVWPHVFVIAAFLAWMTRFQIMPEERQLLRRFGDDYQAYMAAVRRWI